MTTATPRTPRLRIKGRRWPRSPSRRQGPPYHGQMAVRRAREEDFEAWLALLVAVASEGRWIGTEAPVDPEQRRERFMNALEDERFAVLLSEVDGRLVGSLTAEIAGGRATLGMWVAADARGAGVGTALVEASLAWARGAHKVALQVWPHNDKAISLYQKVGFTIEGRLRRHYRRRNGELWDALEMGLVLDHSSPGSPYEDAPAADHFGERASPPPAPPRAEPWTRSV